MPLFLSPVCNDQTFDANGDPLNAGQIETYLAGSSTPAATYTDDTGGTPQSNPIILNSLGYPTLGPIWLTGGQSYKFIIKDSLGVTLRTIDDISGVNDASVSQSEWVTSGFVPTYINATSFSVPGDQTAILQINRRLRTTNTSGLIYSTISNSVFAAGITTVTVVNDSGTLDAGLSVIEYGLTSATNNSVPAIPVTRFTMATSRILGRDTASTGPVEELTGSEITALLDKATVSTEGVGFLPINYVAGLLLSTAGSSATMTVSAGQASDTTGSYLMRLASAISKTTSAWAVGSGNGGLDAGSIANNTWYHFYLIRRPDTGVVDVVYSLSASAPTLPTNYTQYQYIWSAKTNGSAQWIQFNHYGDYAEWLAPVSDVSGAATTANRTLQTLTTPLGLKTRAHVQVGHSGAVTATHATLLTSPDQTDTTPSVSAFTVLGSNQSSTAAYGSTANVWTNTSSQIGSRSTSTNNHYINTIGWFYPRGRGA